MAWWMIAGAAVGAITGAISTWQQGEQEKNALRKQRETSWKQYELGQKQSDAQYAIQREEARFQAFRAGQRLDEDVDMSADQMNAALLAQAFGVQDARIQSASGIGASRAAEGASGTRGNAAGDMVRAYAAQGLERNIEVQQRQNDLALRDLTTGANNSRADIAHERDSWDPGGYRWQMKELQDAYNRDVAKLGQSSFNWQIDQANPTAFDYLTTTLGGAAQGASFGGQIGGMMEQMPKGQSAQAYNYNSDWNTMFSRNTTDYSSPSANPLGINSDSFFKKYYAGLGA
jgi:hypothetical protein